MYNIFTCMVVSLDFKAYVFKCKVHYGLCHAYVEVGGF